MLFQISRERWHRLLILITEKSSAAEIAVQAFLLRVPLPGALEVGDAGRTLVLVGSDRSHVVKGESNRWAKLMNERRSLSALGRGNSSRHVFRGLILLRPLRGPVFRSAARGIAKLLAQLLGKHEFLPRFFPPSGSFQQAPQHVMRANGIVLRRRRSAKRGNCFAQKRLSLSIARGGGE